MKTKVILIKSCGGLFLWKIIWDHGLFWAVRLGTLKPDNLQYNALDRWVAGMNNSSTKRQMFQVFFFHIFLQKSFQKSFQFITLFFIILQK
jgi:hypothetical protein